MTGNLDPATRVKTQAPGGRRKLGWRLPGRWAGAPLGTLAVAAVLLALPSSALAQGPTDASGLSVRDGSTPSVPANVTATLSVNETGYTLSPMFWGTTVSARAQLIPNEGSLVNATPTQVVVWPGANAGDDYDPLAGPNGTIYTPQFTATLPPGPHAPPTSEAAFVRWCDSIHCTAIFQVPGQIDNPTLAAQIVNYTLYTLHFHPAYWEIGNEPERWNYWRCPWTNWTRSTCSGYPSTVTPLEYAFEVGNYTAAMRAGNSNQTIRIIGLPGTGRPNGPYTLTQWVTNVTRYDGREVNAVAYHDYPAGSPSSRSATLLNFYGALDSPAGLVQRVDNVSRAIFEEGENLSCLACEHIPVFVTEIGSALSNHRFANLSRSFPGALSLAAQVIQGIDLNLTNLDLYGSVLDTSNSWFDLNGTPRPDYTLYSEVLSHLGSEAFRATLTPMNWNGPINNHTLPTQLYAIATLDPEDGNRADLMMVNLNLTKSVNFTPMFPDGVPSDRGSEGWAWDGLVNPSMTVVNGTTPSPVPTSYPNGLPSTVTLPPQSVELFETYPASGDPVQFNESGLDPGTRWFVSVDGTLRTSNGTSNLTVFLPPGSHTVTSPALPLLTEEKVVPKARIEPFPTSPIDVASGAVYESIPFVRQWAVTVTVTPSGAGTVIPAPSWWNASTPLVLEALPRSGEVFARWYGAGEGSVNNSTDPEIAPYVNGSIRETARFVAGFAVLFIESGLPATTPWWITVRNTTKESVGSTIDFNLSAGTHAYTATSVSGYRATPARAAVTVPPDSTKSVTVRFEQVTYLVKWDEFGLGTDPRWTVDVGGTTAAARGAWIEMRLGNGTSDYRVPRVGDYIAHPRVANFTVDGRDLTIDISFLRAMFPIEFVAKGLPTGAAWTLRFSDSNVSVTQASAEVWAPNLTYSFDVRPPTGYYASPSHGTLTVDGSPMRVEIAFLPSGFGPIPPIWTLAGPAVRAAAAVGLTALGTVALLSALRRKGGRAPGEPPPPHPGALPETPPSEPGLEARA